MRGATAVRGQVRGIDWSSADAVAALAAAPSGGSDPTPPIAVCATPRLITLLSDALLRVGGRARVGGKWGDGVARELDVQFGRALPEGSVLLSR